MRDLLALLVNDSEPSADTSWGFIAGHYPGALVELLRANVGFLRRGEWYTALFLVGGVLALLLLVWRRRETRSVETTLMCAAAVLGARLRPGRPGLQRLPARARLRADGRLRRRARGGAGRSQARRADAGSQRSSNPPHVGRRAAVVRLPQRDEQARPSAMRTDMRAKRQTHNGSGAGFPPGSGACFALVAVVAALVQLGGSSAAVADPPELVGEWSAPFAWPIVAVHMSLTSTGEVFALDGFGPALNSERVWNPTTGLFRSVPYGRNLFCSGHVQLPDGRTLLVGGHINAYRGARRHDALQRPDEHLLPRRPTWPRRAGTRPRRSLPDGRVLVFAGDRIVQDRPGALPPFSDASVNSLPEIYNPTTNTWTSLTSGTADDAALSAAVRPLGRADPGRRAGHDDARADARPVDVVDRGDEPVRRAQRGHVPAEQDHEVRQLGRSRTSRARSRYDTNGRTAVIDMSAPTPAWRETAPMAHGRAYHNMTLLPDGTVLASGGSSRSDGVDLSRSVLPAEIWNPDTETWTTVDSLQNGRQYHSTALLLPDGRVLMAGGGAVGGGTRHQERRDLLAAVPLQGPAPA